MSRRSRSALFLGLVAGVGAVGLALAAWVPRTPEARKAALWGVSEAAFSGLLVLELKRWAVAWSLAGALAVVGAVFMLRLLMMAVGLVLVVRAGLPGVAFTVGFFGVYFVLQWIEVAYVLVESKRRDPGGV